MPFAAKSLSFLLLLLECHMLYCQNDIDPCNGQLTEGTPSAFNIVINCSSATRVFVGWTQVESNRINWLSLYYHCSSNETYKILENGLTVPNYPQNQIISTNSMSNTATCVVRGCYQKVAPSYPIVNIANVSCIQALASTVSADSRNDSEYGYDHVHRFYTALASSDSRNDSGATTVVMATGIVLAMCIAVSIALAGGVIIKIKLKPRKCTDHDVIGSAVSGDEFNINVDPAKAAEIRSVNSTDISYSELEVTVGTDAAAGDEAGRRFKDYV
eukprot:Em0007g328a